MERNGGEVPLGRQVRVAHPLLCQSGERKLLVLKVGGWCVASAGCGLSCSGACRAARPPEESCVMAEVWLSKPLLILPPTKWWSVTTVGILSLGAFGITLTEV
jgi:hypothetical protein